MTVPEFQLVPLGTLRIHEEIVEADVADLVRSLRMAGVVTEPLWVDRTTLVILNGHHRHRALTELGAHLAPAWLLRYEDPAIELDRWGDGPPITKAEVIERAMERRPFPPKTTRHRLRLTLPAHPTTLEELGVTPDAITGTRRG